MLTSKENQEKIKNAKKSLNNLIKDNYGKLYSSYESKDETELKEKENKLKEQINSLTKLTEEEFKVLSEIEERKSKNIKITDWTKDNYYEPDFEKSKFYQDNKNLLEYYKNSENPEFVNKYNELVNNYRKEQANREKEHFNLATQLVLTDITSRDQEKNPIFQELTKLNISPNDIIEYNKWYNILNNKTKELDYYNDEAKKRVAQYGEGAVLSKEFDVLWEKLKGIRPLEPGESRSDVKSRYYDIDIKLKLYQKNIGVQSHSWDRKKLETLIENIENDPLYIKAQEQIKLLTNKFNPQNIAKKNKFQAEKKFTNNFIQNYILPKLLDYKNLSSEIPFITTTEEDKKELIQQGQSKLVKDTIFNSTSDLQDPEQLKMLLTGYNNTETNNIGQLFGLFSLDENSKEANDIFKAFRGISWGPKANITKNEYNKDKSKYVRKIGPKGRVTYYFKDFSQPGIEVDEEFLKDSFDSPEFREIYSFIKGKDPKEYYKKNPIDALGETFDVIKQFGKLGNIKTIKDLKRFIADNYVKNLKSQDYEIITNGKKENFNIKNFIYDMIEGKLTQDEISQKLASQLVKKA